MPLHNTLIFTNGKGGVGKTSLTANFCGTAARAGWRILAVDLDPQGNLGYDLGIDEESDDGKSLLAAVKGTGKATPLPAVRPSVNGGCFDLLPGGEAIADIDDHLHLEFEDRGWEAYALLGDALKPLARNYDLIVCDTPPSRRHLQRALSYMARWAVVPTLADERSLEGLADVNKHLLTMRKYNPNIYVVGVALMMVNPSATTVLRELRKNLTDALGTAVPVFEQTVRLAQVAAVDLRSRGLLSSEYERDAANALPWYEAKKTGATQQRFSSAASKLAEDYQRLSEEILDLIYESISKQQEI